MDKTQAAKIAQAYQWLSEGKEVEWRYSNGEWMVGIYSNPESARTSASMNKPSV